MTRVADEYTKLVIGRPNDLSTSPQVFGRLYVGELVIWKSYLEDFEVMHAYRNSGSCSEVIALICDIFYVLSKDTDVIGSDSSFFQGYIWHAVR